MQHSFHNALDYWTECLPTSLFLLYSDVRCFSFFCRQNAYSFPESESTFNGADSSEKHEGPRADPLLMSTAHPFVHPDMEGGSGTKKPQSPLRTNNETPAIPPFLGRG
jgi:hypothetical protein